jgi:hypothetical protein
MSKKREKIKEKQLQGFKYFKAISGMLESLHDAGCHSDRAGNRLLQMDQSVGWVKISVHFYPCCFFLKLLLNILKLYQTFKPSQVFY